ncbi:MAG: hypothetical protein DME19_17815 [Verrucomicrobia bacterium]|nr:MAG: hypothetical protein DME19_17815 [Verrucomicrobiota bacterium]
MKNADGIFAVIAVCILLLLTPWPTAMMIASAIGLVAWFVVYRGRRRSGALLAPVVGFAVAAAIAIVISLSRSH